MSLLVLTFLMTGSVSFAVSLVCVSGNTSSKFSRRRLSAIHNSIRSHTAGLEGSELEKAEPWGRYGRLDRFLERFNFAKNFKLLLLHADSKMSLGGGALASAGAGLAGGAVASIFSAPVPVALGAAAAACMVPYGLLRFKGGRRLHAFNEALPDAIDLIARSLQAGHSMGSSIEMVAEQAPEPLAFEFVQIFQQQRLGLQFRDALLQMGERVPSRDLHFLITAILVQKETGGDLTEILARASYVIRERVRIEGEVRTKTAQGRLTGWILSLLPVVMLIIINLISPGYSSVLFHDPVGQKLLYTGVVFIGIGALIIRKIVAVEV